MKLRRLQKLLMILSVILTTPQNIDAALKIYRLSGDVKIKQPSGLSVLQRRDAVKPSDKLVIPAGSKVEILDSESRRIYTSTGQGTFSVKDIIAKAKAAASEVTRLTNSQVVAAVKDNAESQRTKYGNTGVSRHETDADLNGLMALPDGMSYLAYLMSIPPTANYDNHNDIVLMRRDFSDSDDTFNFAVFNTLDEPLYVNIIDQKPDGELSLYFQDNPLIRPRGETLVPEYRYLLPVETHGYIVIASDKNFTLEEVKRLLDPSHTPATNFYFSLLRI